MGMQVEKSYRVRETLPKLWIQIRQGYCVGQFLQKLLIQVEQVIV